MSEKIKPMESGKIKMNPEEIKKLLEAATDVKCPHCNGKVFSEGFAIKKISGLDIHNPTGQDSFTQLPVIYCVQCKNPLQG